MARKLSQPEPAPQRALVDVCVHGQPISAQTARRDLLNNWKRQVAVASTAAWPQPPLQGNVRLRVTYYCESTRIDVDNLKKPIQDALQEILYVNDR